MTPASMAAVVAAEVAAHWGTWTAILVCVALDLWQRVLPARFRFSDDNLNVSGNSVAGNRAMGVRFCSRPWTLVTATLHHSSHSHTANNCILLLATGPQLEARVGGLGFLVLFLALGAAGWAASLVYTRVVYADQWRDGIAQWRQSNGNSPAAYGLATMAVVLLGAEEPVANAFGMGAWFWVAAITFVPKFLGTGYRVSLLNPGSTAGLARSLAFAVLAMTLSVFVLRPRMPTLSPAGWFSAYLTSTFASSLLIQVLLFGKPLGGSDNPCHLGGAFAGLASAVVYVAGSYGSTGTTGSCSDGLAGPAPPALVEAASCGAEEANVAMAMAMGLGDVLTNSPVAPEEVSPACERGVRAAFGLQLCLAYLMCRVLYDVYVVYRERRAEARRQRLAEEAAKAE